MSKDFARHYRINEERRIHKENKPIIKEVYGGEFWSNYSESMYQPSNGGKQSIVFRPESVKNFKRFINNFNFRLSIIDYVNWINVLISDKNLFHENIKEFAIYDKNCSRVYFLLDNLWITNKLINDGLNHAEICHYLLDFISKQKPTSFKIKMLVMIVYNMEFVKELEKSNKCKYVYKI